MARASAPLRTALRWTIQSFDMVSNPANGSNREQEDDFKDAAHEQRTDVEIARRAEPAATALYLVLPPCSYVLIPVILLRKRTLAEADRQ